MKSTLFLLQVFSKVWLIITVLAVTAEKIPLSGRIEASLRGRYILDLANATSVTFNKIFGANYASGVIWGAVANTFIKGKWAILLRHPELRVLASRGLLDTPLHRPSPA